MTTSSLSLGTAAHPVDTRGAARFRAAVLLTHVVYGVQVSGYTLHEAAAGVLPEPDAELQAFANDDYGEPELTPNGLERFLLLFTRGDPRVVAGTTHATLETLVAEASAIERDPDGWGSLVVGAYDLDAGLELPVRVDRTVQLFVGAPAETGPVV